MIHAVYSLFIISAEKNFVKHFLQKRKRLGGQAVKERKLTDKNYKVFTNDAKMSMIVVAHRFKNERLGRGGPV